MIYYNSYHKIRLNNQCLTLKALPYVILHFPPVGLVRTFLQLLQAITD